MIERHGSKLQVCCDTCPTSYPNTYATEDFDVMISDARASGWRVNRTVVEASSSTGTDDLFAGALLMSGKTAELKQRFRHTCPDCQLSTHQGALL